MQFVTGQPGAQRALSGVLCEVGEVRPSGGGVFFTDLSVAPIAFYTLLDPAQCVSCTSGVLEVQTAELDLAFGEGCSVFLRVSVVEINGDPMCPAPDTTRVLFAPFVSTITADFHPFFESYAVSLPASFYMTRKAFLRIQVFGSTCLSPPSLGAAQPPGICPTCRSYWQFPVAFGGGPIQDACSVGGFRSWAQRITAACAETSPTRAQSWGRLKQIYR